MIYHDFPDKCAGSGSKIHQGGYLELTNGTFKAGCNFQLHAKITVKEGASCRFGDDCTVRGRIIVEMNSTLIVGDGLICNDNVDIRSAEGCCVEIGNDCLFANPIIYNSDMHSIFNISSGSRINLAENVFIGNHVWLAQGVRILKGSFIANDSVVAADSLVNKKYPANSLIGGSPARLLREGISWDRSLTHSMPISFDDNFSKAGFVSAARRFDHDKVIDMGRLHFDKWPHSTHVDYYFFYYLMRSICEKYLFVGKVFEENIDLASAKNVFDHCFSQSSYSNMPCGAYAMLVG